MHRGGIRVARHTGEARSERGARLQTALLVAAAVVLAGCVVLALSQWFERLS